MRVFNPLSQTYHNNSLAQCFRRNELEKRRAYDERIREIEHGSFLPLIFSTSGSMGPTATTVYKRLAAMIAEKNNKSYSKTIHWLRCCLSFSLLRSAIYVACGVWHGIYVTCGVWHGRSRCKNPVPHPTRYINALHRVIFRVVRGAVNFT